MIVLICPNLQKPQALPLTCQIRDFLLSRGITVVCPEACAGDLNLMPMTGKEKEIDLVVSLGGDGSILSFIHSYPYIEAPIMGVNLGSLGFLADIPAGDVITALEEVLAGNYSVQKRLMIAGLCEEGKECLAVNEVVVHRGQNHTLVDISLSVDGKYLSTFSADGIIVATPSGSTAYSLSAGGPIIAPDLEAICLTPICPHALSHRPIVITVPQEITLQYLSPYKPVEISFDGVYRSALAPGQTFSIYPAKRFFFLVALSRIDYFAALRNKLGLMGTLKP